jgi:hypothetical protein
LEEEAEKLLIKFSIKVSLGGGRTRDSSVDLTYWKDGIKASVTTDKAR